MLRSGFPGSSWTSAFQEGVMNELFLLLCLNMDLSLLPILNCLYLNSQVFSKFLLFPIPSCSGRKRVSSYMGLSCCSSPVARNKSSLWRTCSTTKTLSSSGPLIYLHRSLLMSFTFLVCKMCISSKINHFGTVLSITQQPWYSTLRNNIPKHLYKALLLLHFADYFSLGKSHLVLYQQNGSLRYFPGICSIQDTSNQAHQEMIWNQFCSGESSGPATDTTKQTGAEWAVITLLSLPSEARPSPGAACALVLIM